MHSFSEFPDPGVEKNFLWGRKKGLKIHSIHVFFSKFSHGAKFWFFFDDFFAVGKQNFRV